jgi:hypothetical protein
VDLNRPTTLKSHSHVGGAGFPLRVTVTQPAHMATFVYDKRNRIVRVRQDEK